MMGSIKYRQLIFIRLFIP